MAEDIPGERLPSYDLQWHVDAVPAAPLLYPDSRFKVVYAVRGWGIGTADGLSPFAIDLEVLTPGQSQTFTEGKWNLIFAVTADGTMTLQQSGGSSPLKVTLRLLMA
jgi:hypothetical protein